MKFMQETYIIQYVIRNSHIVLLFYVVPLGLHFSKLISKLHMYFIVKT
jgi:hypothetical protein